MKKSNGGLPDGIEPTPSGPAGAEIKGKSQAKGKERDKLGRKTAKSSGKFQGRVSEAEVDKRIYTAKVMLAQGLDKREIKGAFRREFNVTSARQIEDYISRAKAELAEERRQDVEALADSSYAFYVSIASDPNESAQARIKARKRADELCGIGLIHKHQHVHAHVNGDEPPKMTKDEAIRKLNREGRAKVIEAQKVLEDAFAQEG